MTEYVQAPEQDVVISSRVRLSRNYDDLPFSPKLTKEYAEEVVERTADVVFSGVNGNAFTLLRMSELEQDARSRLVEHHYISYDLLKYVQRSAAMVSSASISSSVALIPSAFMTASITSWVRTRSSAGALYISRTCSRVWPVYLK